MTGKERFNLDFSHTLYTLRGEILTSEIHQLFYCILNHINNSVLHINHQSGQDGVLTVTELNICTLQCGLVVNWIGMVVNWIGMCWDLVAEVDVGLF